MRLNDSPLLKKAELSTPLGPLMAISDEEVLYYLNFMDYGNLGHDIEKLKASVKSPVLSGRSGPIDSIEKELHLYFQGMLREFKTPLFLIGSSFQKEVWKGLNKTPYGETRSYADVAALIGNPSASRAVGRANSTNPMVIVIPCHRVINANGHLGGYTGGLFRKEWLLEHEKNQFKAVQ